jgi:hypothetical protein
VGRTIVPGGKKMPRKVTNEFYTDEGAIIGGKFHPKDGGDPQPLEVDYELQPGSIFQNFIDCVRSRKHENLHADILEAHYSSALCHLGNISYRLGEKVSGSTKPEALPDNEHVWKSFEAIKEHLKAALGLELATTTYQLGPKLEFDPAAEKFVGNAEADKLLTREYRKPFVVTESV